MAWDYEHLFFALQRISDKEKAAGALMFKHKPDRWWADATWRCPKDHVSKSYLKAEERGSVCVKCGEYVALTFPEDKDGPL